MKEQESMKFKELEDDARMKRRQQAALLEEKARMLEESDRLAQEEEVRKKQAEIRAARAAQELLKKEKELKEAELHREMLELQAMRKEERDSIAVEKAIADKIAREEKRRLEKLAREEAEREAERLRIIAEEERKAKAELEKKLKAEAAAKKKEKDREFSESRLMSREDYDVGPEPPPVEEEKTPDTEVEVVEPPPAPVVLTGAKLKLFNIIAKLVASKSGQKDHPRKNNNPQYFMPLTFGRDMRFDPFALNQHWDGPPNLNDDDEDEDSMPKVGYDDITKAIQERKNAIEKRKKDQLYQLNNPDVPSKDWTPMFRVDPIDW
eukprot:CAMPEP_0174823348 /NCGR_PEP_ID=MMETSP1107-20130205/23730_1 /TAXON_ID=36770 /ORGANISM="Paraphysomonas vestita, Strain GFlagA" /LENGTH=321 /DNA_ID=CAMNT_0016045539 /DNA_START=75 /DNA_END=1037 /DNA_ORIENTATION=+